MKDSMVNLKKPTDNLFRIRPNRLNGLEQFKSDGRLLDFEVMDFWRWSTSDLVSNATRGRLAEYIVARTLGVDTSGVRDEWAAYDLDTPEGIKVEVKSSAYLQSWAQRQPSSVLFSVRKARAWDPESNLQAPIPTRMADVYVFALLAHLDKSTLDPLNIDQWEFYVLPTKILNERNRSQHSITVASLRKLCAGPISAKMLRQAVTEAHVLHCAP
jgi:hypothetical protein